MSTGKSGGKTVAGARDMRVKVKKAGKLKHSSQLWLERQLNDPYVKRAKELGYRSRAAFKLEEMDDRYKFLKPGQRLVDLGCAPGGWCQIAAKRIGLERGKGHIVGIALAEAAIEFAHDVLAPGGFFLAKLFQGGDSAELLGELKRDFTTVRNVKPAASRSDSSELYVLATGYRRAAREAAGNEAE